MIRHMLKLAVAGAVGLGFFALAAAAADSEEYAPGVASDGKIRVPDVDFRKDWAFLGTWVVNEKGKNAKGIHNVYTQPSTIEAYRKTGTFPDGAVLVKELLATETKRMTTGVISRAGDVEGWFVMVKDTEGRFKGNKLWGDGWGWALFNSPNRTETVTKNYRANCLGCHIPAKKNDWVFTEGYPVLHSKQ